MKTCAFFGHRNVEASDNMICLLRDILKDLIVNGTIEFIFGSKSQFDTICYQVVSELKEIYPHINRISFNAPHEEVFTSQKEKEYFENVTLKLFKRKECYKLFEKAFDSENAVKAKRNAYIARNKDMIDKSDVCLFYYDENYQPPLRVKSKYLYEYQPKSGTGYAYQYAKQKKKHIINIFPMLKKENKIT